MSLLDDLADAKNYGQGTRCAVEVMLATLPPDEASMLRATINAKIVHATRLADILTRNGHEINGTSIARHRRGGCRCQTS